MKMIFHLFSITCMVRGLLGSPLKNSNYERDNITNIEHWKFGDFFLPGNKSIKYTIDFYSPKNPGNYPVIVFLGGFDGKNFIYFFLN